MDENKFFKVLWRVNAILMTCACVLGIGNFIYQQIVLRRTEHVSEGYYNLQTSHLSETGETIVDANWRFGVPKPVTNSLVLLPIYALEEEAKLRGSNLLLIDTNEPEGAKWLWPESPYRAWNDLLMFDEKTIAVLYEAEDREGNSSVYLTYPGGTELTLIIKDAERVIDYIVMTEKDLMIFYVKAGEGRVMKVDLTDFSVVVDTALPDPP